MLFAALSCLQGRPLQKAAAELWALEVDGLQLTPGCVPNPAVPAVLEAHAIPTRTHQGFTPLAYRAPVWSKATELLCQSDSVHPPTTQHAAAFFAAAERGDLAGVAFETMYPGYTLGNAADLHRAMTLELDLAVDVSHLFLQLTAGTLDHGDVRQLCDYEHVVEVHVSANDGSRDQHAPLQAESYGLGFARACLAAGVPVVLECYLHRLDSAQRATQFALVRDALGAA